MISSKAFHSENHFPFCFLCWMVCLSIFFRFKHRKIRFIFVLNLIYLDVSTSLSLLNFLICFFRNIHGSSFRWWLMGVVSELHFSSCFSVRRKLRRRFTMFLLRSTLDLDVRLMRWYSYTCKLTFWFWHLMDFISTYPQLLTIVVLWATVFLSHRLFDGNHLSGSIPSTIGLVQTVEVL